MEDRQDVTKIYCEKCDTVFDSRKKYERHMDRYSGAHCESCPLDNVVERLSGLFRRK